MITAAGLRESNFPRRWPDTAASGEIASVRARNRPLGHCFRSPNRVALCLFADGSWVVENFNDEPATVELDGSAQEVAARGWLYHWK